MLLVLFLDAEALLWLLLEPQLKLLPDLLLDCLDALETVLAQLFLETRDLHDTFRS